MSRRALALVVAAGCGLALPGVAAAAPDDRVAARPKKKPKKRAKPKKPAPAAPAPVVAPEPIAAEPVAAPIEPVVASPAPTAIEAAPLERDDGPARPRGRRAPPRLRIAVDERPFWRRLRFNDDLRRVTRSYDLAANAVGVELAVRPVAGQPGLTVTAAGLLAIGVNGSRTSDDTSYPTKASEWSLAVGYGGPLGPVQLGGRLGYGEHRFQIADDPAMGPELLPDVTYRWARAGVDARAALTPRWDLQVSGGGRYLLGTGDLTGADWFPHATGQGVDGTIGLGFALASRVSLYARAEVRHYFFAMNPEIGDPMIVGGATDTYLGGAVGAALGLW